MLVYGDHHELSDPAEHIRAVDRQLRAAEVARGIKRHALLVGALVEAGRVLQGMVDAEFAQAGRDRCWPECGGIQRYVSLIAQAVVSSWDSHFEATFTVPTAPEFPASGKVELRVPEGFAFYAVYPEAYVEAARRLMLRAAPRVIGIRSIGATLAAVVAAALNAPPPVTVRPFGDPHARRIALDPEFERELIAGEPHYVIVDEGPGLSGSSFGAVADWLQERGVPADRIAFLPSHRGPLGPQASDAHRDRWRRAQRVTGDFGDQLGPMLGGWATDLLGRLDGPLEEMSAGEWRRRALPREAEWPAIQGMWERRKFLASAGGEQFVLKFAGLGAIGERKLTMARALHAAGLTPEPLGLVHGFLVERWCAEGGRLGARDKPVGEIARYIGARARLFPAPDGAGASLDELLAMARRNVGLAFGDGAAAELDRWQPRLEPLSRRIVRVCTDNKLDRHEWLRSSGSQLLKTDALDHHCGHDLVGCQDLAWDVAGAICEFGLNAEESEALACATQRAAGRHLDPELLGFYRLAYPAFRLGQASMVLDACGTDTAEADRLSAVRARYAAELQHLLQRSSAATPQESWVS